MVGVLLEAPPVLPTEYEVPAQTTKRFVRSGVVMLPVPSVRATVCPLHNAHPEGTLDDEPDHKPMKPVGTRAVLS